MSCSRPVHYTRRLESVLKMNSCITENPRKEPRRFIDDADSSIVSNCSSLIVIGRTLDLTTLPRGTLPDEPTCQKYRDCLIALLDIALEIVIYHSKNTTSIEMKPTIYYYTRAASQCCVNTGCCNIHVNQCSPDSLPSSKRTDRSPSRCADSFCAILSPWK